MAAGEGYRRYVKAAEGIVDMIRSEVAHQLAALGVDPEDLSRQAADLLRRSAEAGMRVMHDATQPCRPERAEEPRPRTVPAKAAAKEAAAKRAAAAAKQPAGKQAATKKTATKKAPAKKAPAKRTAAAAKSLVGKKTAAAAKKRGSGTAP